MIQLTWQQRRSIEGVLGRGAVRGLSLTRERFERVLQTIRWQAEEFSKSEETHHEQGQCEAAMSMLSPLLGKDATDGVRSR